VLSVHRGAAPGDAGREPLKVIARWLWPAARYGAGATAARIDLVAPGRSRAVTPPARLESTGLRPRILGRRLRDVALPPVSRSPRPRVPQSELGPGATPFAVRAIVIGARLGVGRSWRRSIARSERLAAVPRGSQRVSAERRRKECPTPIRRPDPDECANEGTRGRTASKLRPCPVRGSGRPARP
jgi:hypothetical protein